MVSIACNAPGFVGDEPVSIWPSGVEHATGKPRGALLVRGPNHRIPGWGCCALPAGGFVGFRFEAGGGGVGVLRTAFGSTRSTGISPLFLPLTLSVACGGDGHLEVSVVPRQFVLSFFTTLQFSFCVVNIHVPLLNAVITSLQ